MLTTTTRQAAGLFPGYACKPVTDGALIGASLLDGSPFRLTPVDCDQEVLPSTGMALLGTLGNGKSTNTKVMSLRDMARTGRRYAVLDAKGEDGVGEWDAVAAALHVTPVRFGDGVCMNPLDPRIPPLHRVQLVAVLAELGGHRPLSPGARMALDAAMESPAARTLSGLMGAVTSLEADAIPGRFDAGQLLAFGQEVVQALSPFIRSATRGMLDGETSVSLDAKLTVFDFSHIDRTSIALPALMSVVGVFLESVWLAQGGADHGIHSTLIVEEAWQILKHPATAALLQRMMKYSRREGLSVTSVAHSAKDATSEEAKDLLRLASTRVLHQMDEGEAEQCRGLFSLPDWAVRQIPLLGRGQAIWQTGRHVNLVQTLVTDYEKRLCFTSRRRDAAQGKPPAPAPVARSEWAWEMPPNVIDHAA
ncbi:ATP-binding protein [Streptomyces atriruber]|uniref:ATP-binding protein n=1 Tax=Streptomyces atriruber TaxID=545121 RepID=UPI0006E19E04|nr:ATP-binding protein [Streptomyces atriruber]